jgi:TrmH family RNA methyltransferase
MIKMVQTRLITSLQHACVKDAVRLRQNRDYRHERKLALVEGVKIVGEVCRQTPAQMIFAVDPERIPQGVKAQETVLVTEAVMQKISGVQTPEGVVAVVPLPAQGNLAGCKRVIALDGLNDPGNVGALLRSALALGWEGAFLLPGCADPYNDKALRASKGAPFRLPIREGTWEDLDALIQQQNWHPLAADLAGIKPEQVPSKDKLLLVLGSEAHGLSEAAKSRCQAVTIPIPGEMESLNVAVAGGVLMYVLRLGSKS